MEMARGSRVQTNAQTAETVWNQAATYTLSVHNIDFSKEEVVVNPDIFKSVKEEEFLEIEVCNDSSLVKKFVVQTGKSISNDSKVKHIQISLIKAIADLFGIDKKVQVKVMRLGNVGDYTIESVGILLKDSYFSRRDMRLIEQHLKAAKQIIYKGKTIEYESQSFRIKSLKLRNPVAPSVVGLTDHKTKFRYFSRSCEAFWVLEISKELYQCSNDGYYLYEKIVDFVKGVFEEFKVQGVSHRVTVVGAGKVYHRKYDHKDELGIEVEASGKICHHFFHKLFTVQSFKSPTLQNVLRLKKTLAEYPDRLNWTYNREEHIARLNLEPYKSYKGVPLGESELSDSQNFCVLEALNICHKEFTTLGRQSLEHTGRQVLILSPGKGVYEVSKELGNITKHLYRSCDCNVDLFAFGYPPLHVVPLFYSSQGGSDKKGVFSKDFTFPYWITLQFVRSDALALSSTDHKDHELMDSADQYEADSLEVEAESLYNIKQEVKGRKPALQRMSIKEDRASRMKHERFEELYFTSEWREKFEKQRFNLAQKNANAMTFNHGSKKPLNSLVLYPKPGYDDRADFLNASSAKHIKKEAYNPFIPLNPRSKHYKGYIYWLYSRELKQDFSRLFGGPKRRSPNFFKYLCETRLFPIEIDDFMYSEVLLRAQ